MSRGVVAWVILLAALLSGCNSNERQLLSLAEARWREGNYDDAIRLNNLLYEKNRQGRYASKALLNLGNIYYLNLRKHDEAVAAYIKLVDEFQGRNEEYEARQQLARIYSNEYGDLTQAIAQYDKLLELNNLHNRTEILYLRASAYYQKEDFYSALREFRQLEDEGVSDHFAHLIYLKIGNIYQIEHKYDESAAYFNRVATAACPECRRQAILDLTETYEALYDFNRAIETIRKLDANSQNRQFIAQEVKRLESNRARMDSGQLLSLKSPHR